MSCVSVSPHWPGLRTLLVREVRRFLKEWLETVVASAASTLLYFVVFVFALGSDRGTPEGREVLDFVLPGLILYTMMSRAAETPSFSLIFDRLEGIIADILMTPPSPTEMAVAYALTGMASGLLTGVVIGLGTILVWPLALAAPWAIAAFAAGGCLMLSLACLMIGLWARKWDQMAAAFTFVLVPAAFLSGTFALIDVLPGWAQVVVSFNPMTYAIDGFRYGFLVCGEMDIGLSLAVVWATNLVLLGLAVHGIRRGWGLRP